MSSFEVSNFNQYLTVNGTNRGYNLKQLEAEAGKANANTSIFDFYNKIKDKDIDGDGIIEINEINGINDTEINAQTKTNLTTAITAFNPTNTNTPTEPTQQIDEAKTTAFREELKNIQELNARIGEDKAKLQEEIDSLTTKVKTAQDDLAKKLVDAQFEGQKITTKTQEEVDKAITSAKEKSSNPENGDFQSLLKTELEGLGINSGAIDWLMADAQGIGGEIKSLAINISTLNDLVAIKNQTLSSFSAKYGELLNVDIDLVSVTQSGQIIVGTQGSGGPEATGAEGISAADMTKFAGMNEDELTTALSSEAYTELLNASGVTANALAKGIKLAADKGELQDAEAGKYGQFNVKERVLNGISMEDLKAECAEANPPKSCDPYEIEIDGVKYVLMKDNGDGQLDDVQDILGYDTDKLNDKSTWGNAFKGIGDGNLTLTRDEMIKNGIQLVAVGSNGALTDKTLDLNQINEITLNSNNNAVTGSDELGAKNVAGSLSVNLANGGKAGGEHTFRSENVLTNLVSGASKFIKGLASSILPENTDPNSTGYKFDPLYENQQTTELLTNTTRILNATLREMNRQVDNARETTSNNRTNNNENEKENNNRKKLPEQGNIFQAAA